MKRKLLFYNIINNKFLKLILELREIISKTKQATSSYLALWEIFINRCKNCLHTVLCLSPIGEKFR